MSYGYNTEGIRTRLDQSPLGLGIKDAEGGGWCPVRVEDVRNPALMIVLADGARAHDGAVWMASAIGRGMRDTNSFRPHPFDVNRHRGDINVAFADGRVRAMSMRTLFEDTSDGALRIWNRDNQPHRERLQ